MSYQEYAQLGKGTRRKDGENARPKGRESDVVDRPYHRATASFSVPRPSPPHSSSSSRFSNTLSPSNSVSLKDACSPAAERSSGRGTGEAAGRADPPALSQLKELELGVGAGKKPNLVKVELPWRPSCLRQRILAVFLFVFVALVVALEVLGDLSNRDAGLGSGGRSRSTRFAWTYLTILALTLLAGMWARVDYQAKAAAPWMRMSRGPAPAEKTLLLDYMKMSLPVSIVKAVLNGDVVVACTSMVSLHLGLLVVVSTALLALSLVDVPRQNARITFNGLCGRCQPVSRNYSLPFLAMLALLQGNTYPYGVSSKYDSYPPPNPTATSTASTNPSWQQPSFSRFSLGSSAPSPQSTPGPTSSPPLPPSPPCWQTKTPSACWAAEPSGPPPRRELFMDGLHLAMGFRMGWETPRRMRREDGRTDGEGGRVFGVSVLRTGGWGGGEGVGLGLQARAGYGHRKYVRDWGWRT